EQGEQVIPHDRHPIHGAPDMPQGAGHVGDHTVLEPLGERSQSRKGSPEIVGHEANQLLAGPLGSAPPLPGSGKGLARFRQLLFHPGELGRQIAIGRAGLNLLGLRNGGALGVADQQPDGVLQPARRQAKAAAHQPSANYGEHQGDTDSQQDHRRVMSRDEHQLDVDHHCGGDREHGNEARHRELVTQRGTPNGSQHQGSKQTNPDTRNQGANNDQKDVSHISSVSRAMRSPARPTVSTMRGSEGSSSSFSRSRRTCTVTVEVSPKSQPHTRRSRSALLKVCPGLAARKASRSNSRLVKDNCDPPRVATWAARSIVTSPIDKVSVKSRLRGRRSARRSKPSRAHPPPAPPPPPRQHPTPPPASPPEARRRRSTSRPEIVGNKMSRMTTSGLVR